MIKICRVVVGSQLMWAACSGAIGGDGTSGAGGLKGSARNEPGAPPGASTPGGSEPGEPGSVDNPAPDTGAVGLRLLDRREYDNTLATLLGDTANRARQFAPDLIAPASGYVSFRPVSPNDLELFRDAAEGAAAAAITRSPSLTACPGPEPDCARSFLNTFGKRAFRRPLTAGEATSLVALYSVVRAQAGSSHREGIRVVMTALLQDPRFLYHRFMGRGPADDDGLVALDGHDLASRLSYALWKNMPDDALFDAAAAGRLDTAQAVNSEAKRMLADHRAGELSATWADRLFDLERLEGLGRPADRYPDWSPAAGQSMRIATEHFVADIMAEAGGVDALLTGSWALVDPLLARIYEVPAPAGGTAARVDLNPMRRAGLLTQASFLTVSPSPVLRGKFVRERLFCQMIPAPPPNAQSMGMLAPAGANDRERASLHSADPACAGCHELMDPIGFGLLNYDAIGKWRDRDERGVVDASGELSGTDVDGAFVGGPALAERLATSEQLRACLANRWFRAVLDREETAADARAIAATEKALAGPDRALHDAVLALVMSPSFRQRKPLPGEEQP